MRVLTDFFTLPTMLVGSVERDKMSFVPVVGRNEDRTHRRGMNPSVTKDRFYYTGVLYLNLRLRLRKTTLHLSHQSSTMLPEQPS